jgi:hypothetical protein
MSEGGKFAVPSFTSFVEFNACNGGVEIIMRAKTIFHGTLPSKTKNGFTRLGTSIQMNKCLVQRMKKFILEKDNGKCVDKKIRGVKEIVAQKLQKCK